MYMAHWVNNYLVSDVIHQVVDVMKQHPKLQIKQALANAFQHEQQHQYQNQQSADVKCQQQELTQQTQLGSHRANHDDVTALQRALQVLYCIFWNLRAVYLTDAFKRTKTICLTTKTTQNVASHADHRVITVRSVMSLAT